MPLKSQTPLLSELSSKHRRKKERNPLAWREFVSLFTKAARESLLFSSCKSSDLSVYLINAFYDTIEYNWTVKTVTVTWNSMVFSGLCLMLFTVESSGQFGH